MTEYKEKPKWLAYYHQQLDIRNQSHSTSFRELIKNYSELMIQFKSLEDEKRTLEREKIAMKSAQYDIYSKKHNRQPTEVLQLNEKVRKMESELTGTYKDQQMSTMQVLELTKQLKEAEYKKMEMEMKFQAASELIKQNAELLMTKV